MYDTYCLIIPKNNLMKWERNKCEILPGNSSTGFLTLPNDGEEEALEL